MRIRVSARADQFEKCKQEHLQAAAISDSSASTETINDARASARLVDPEGDVIWTGTQESKGAKYKGATADVADKIVKQLLRDLEKLEKKSAPQSQPVGLAVK